MSEVLQEEGWVMEYGKCVTHHACDCIEADRAALRARVQELEGVLMKVHGFGSLVACDEKGCLICEALKGAK